MGEARTGLELRSMITSGGKLVLNLEEVLTEAPGPDEVVVRVEAAPITPSDLGLLLGPADMTTTELAIRHALGDTRVASAIIGFASRSQVDEAVRFAEKGRLPSAVRSALDEIPLPFECP